MNLLVLLSQLLWISHSSPPLSLNFYIIYIIFTNTQTPHIILYYMILTFFQFFSSPLSFNIPFTILTASVSTHLKTYPSHLNLFSLIFLLLKPLLCTPLTSTPMALNLFMFMAHFFIIIHFDGTFQNNVYKNDNVNKIYILL